MQAFDQDPQAGTTSLAIAAELLSVSSSTIRRMVAAGKTPAPIRVGKTGIRFDSQEFDSWLAAGAPRRERWDKMWLRRSNLAFRCSCGKRWSSRSVWKFVANVFADLLSAPGSLAATA